MQFVERGDWMDDSNQFQPEPDLLDPTSWEQAIALYGKMLYRVIRLHVKNKEDADDLYQETFSRLMGNRKPFSDETHRKAWLLRVALNLCKDFNKSTWQRRVVSLENSVSLSVEDEEDSGVMQAVMKLPEKMRTVVHLHYYEGYTVPEISQLLNRKENSIYSDLSRARLKLKKWLEP
jgi:RNA polymerase sigma-70 factor (ECF subfamily)